MLMKKMHQYEHWMKFIKKVLSIPKHTELRIPKYLVTSPTEIGFEKTNLGYLKDANCQYRLMLEDGRSLHLLEYDSYYTLHWDEKDPRIDPLGHLFFDAPEILLLSFFFLLVLFSLSDRSDSYIQHIDEIN